MMGSCCGGELHETVGPGTADREVGEEQDGSREQECLHQRLISSCLSRGSQAQSPIRHSSPDRPGSLRRAAIGRARASPAGAATVGAAVFCHAMFAQMR